MVVSPWIIYPVLCSHSYGSGRVGRVYLLCDHSVKVRDTQMFALGEPIEGFHYVGGIA